MEEGEPCGLRVSLLPPAPVPLEVRVGPWLVWLHRSPHPDPPRVFQSSSDQALGYGNAVSPLAVMAPQREGQGPQQLQT